MCGLSRLEFLTPKEQAAVRRAASIRGIPPREFLRLVTCAQQGDRTRRERAAATLPAKPKKRSHHAKKV